jgi:hypothetical protein
LATLGGLTSERYLAEARKYVDVGGKLYLEGLPEKDIYDEPRPHRLDKLIGAQITAVVPQMADMVLPKPGEVVRLQGPAAGKDRRNRAGR